MDPLKSHLHKNISAIIVILLSLRFLAKSDCVCCSTGDRRGKKGHVAHRDPRQDHKGQLQSPHGWQKGRQTECQVVLENISPPILG